MGLARSRGAMAKLQVSSVYLLKRAELAVRGCVEIAFGERRSDAEPVLHPVPRQMRRGHLVCRARARDGRAAAIDDGAHRAAREERRHRAAARSQQQPHPSQRAHGGRRTPVRESHRRCHPCRAGAARRIRAGRAGPLQPSAHRVDGRRGSSLLPSEAAADGGEGQARAYRSPRHRHAAPRAPSAEPDFRSRRGP